MAVDFPSASTGDTTVQGNKRFLYNGSGFQAIAAGLAVPLKVQVFTSSGTYTPTAGMQYAIIECVGSGAGGGGCAATTGSNQGGAGGGGGGGYSRVCVTAAQIGTSQTVTVGNAGTGGAAGNNNGTDGADVSVGTLCVGKGGTHGNGAAANSNAAGGAGGVTGTGDVTLPGGDGQGGLSGTINTVILYNGGPGGNAGGGFGQGGKGAIVTNGQSGSGYGSGGGGGGDASAVGAKSGADGKKGIAVITEFGVVPSISPFYPSEPINMSLTCSASASALTIALKDAGGNDPTPASPCFIPFRNATETTGSLSWMPVTAATSLVISSGSTMGVTSSTAFRIWIVGFNDSGTFRLGAINCVTGALDSFTVYPLTQWAVSSSTAEGGAGAADSAGVIYTGTAVTSKPMTVLGFLEWSSSGLTAGTWTTSNLLRIQAIGKGVPLPGATVQRLMPAAGGADFSTTSATYVYATSNTVSITPTSAANVIAVTMAGGAQSNAAGRSANIRLSRGTTANTNMFGNPCSYYSSAGDMVGSPLCIGSDKPNTTSATTYAVQLRSVLGGSVSFYGPSAVGTYWDVREIMG